MISKMQKIPSTISQNKIEVNSYIVQMSAAKPGI